MVATVDSLLPLSLLHAVRNVDTPVGDFEAEFVPELRNKRLGLSETVYTQIRRYSDAVKRNQRTPVDESVALARLIGRRPDAEAVFRDAGRYLAKEAYLTLSGLTRNTIRSVPSVVGRRLALVRVRRLARRYMNGTVTRTGGSVVLDVPEPVTADAIDAGGGCAFYEAGLREMLRLLLGDAGSVEHVKCTTRGDGHCEWRAEFVR